MRSPTVELGAPRRVIGVRRGRIVEREPELAQLAEAARDAASGRGCVVLVSGEAGIGKSSVVGAIRGRLPAEGRMLVGHCDDMSTARTLGPLRDLMGSVGAELSAALRDGDDRDRILTALRTELDWPGHPTVLAIEDVHWADDATLDMLRYLVRRVAQLPVVLVLTYRDDELGRDHPLHQLLGLVTAQGRRLELRPLSLAAVRELSAVAGGLAAEEVFTITSGNPFFVSEVLAAGHDAGVPRTVTDAVLARLGRLDGAAREAVEQLSVVPTMIDRRLLTALVPDGLAALAVAEERGLVVVTSRGVAFRHELTRRTVADALPASRRAVLNARVLAALVDDPTADVARIVHHAAEAGDCAAIHRFGPSAARSAAEGGAHREAAAHYRLVLDQALPDQSGACTPADRAQLLEDYAVECQAIGQGYRALAGLQEAVELRRTLGEDAAVSAALHRLARLQWLHGDLEAANTALREEIAVARRLGDPRHLALAYGQWAVRNALAFLAADAQPYAERAVAYARATGDPGTLSYTLNNLGIALWKLGQDRGRELLEESLRVALAAGVIDHACRAYVNIGWELLNEFRLDDAEAYVNAGLALAEQTEQLGFVDFLYVHRARIELGRGAWDDAIRSTDLRETYLPTIRCPARTVSGRARARRGDPDAAAELASAVDFGRGVGELQWLGPAACAAAEDAWLRGDHPGVVAVACPVFVQLSGRDAGALLSELGFWLRKAGRPVEVPPSDTPYGLLVAGRWREAADHWHAQGCRYEYALALAESSAPQDLLTALEVLDELGAKPLARIVRARLRELGVAAVPRGPAAVTRSNPARLTGRQLEVLRLLADGLSNAEIANRLVVSTRTVDNHVAAVFTKLGVRSRADAVNASREMLAG